MLADVAPELCLLALQLENPGAVDQTPLQELHRAGQLFVDQRQLPLGGADLLFEAQDLLLEPGNGPPENVRSLGKERATALEDAPLARHSIVHRGVRGAGVELVGEVDRRQAVALGGEAGRRGARLEVLRLHLVQDRGREGVAQPDQEIAFLNAAAFADEDLLDDPALQVLHRLDVAVDADNARARPPRSRSGQARPRRSCCRQRPR